MSLFSYPSFCVLSNDTIVSDDNTPTHLGSGVKLLWDLYLSQFFFSDEEEKNVSQSSEFDFDEVDESFCQKMRDNTAEDRTEDERLNMPSLTKQGDETEKQSSNKDTEDNGVNIIDLTSDVELESEGCSTKQDSDLQSGSEKQQNPQLKLEPDSEKIQSHTQADEKVDKTVQKVEVLNTDTAPPLISAEDLSKLAAQNPTVADEPPVLIKMNVPSRRVSNSLEDMISRLKTRVLTTQPPSSDSSLNGGDEQLLGDVLDKRSSDKSPESTENPFGVTVEPISDASSPETENLESCPASPASLRSDVSKTESLDRKSEISTASSRRSGGMSSKPPAKKFKSEWQLKPFSYFLTLAPSGIKVPKRARCSEIRLLKWLSLENENMQALLWVH